MKFLRFIAAAFAAATVQAFVTPALATPQHIDATGLWMNPEESGWGISVYHQGDTLFASLFVYGPDGAPKWYTASGLTGNPSQFSGPLVEATGPYFGATLFNAGSVTRRIVGTMTITLNTYGSGGVFYMIDGVQVASNIHQVSLRTIPTTGSYIGAEVDPDADNPLILDQHFTLNDSGSQLDIFTDSNRTTSCSYYGSTYNSMRRQTGNAIWANGNGTCGGKPTEPWGIIMAPTPHGFTGNASWMGPTGELDSASVAAAKRGTPSLQGTGYINDLWFPPDESGWGLNLVEQGDAAFATLFVYDAQNRPHWYSASQLVSGTSGGRPSWSGPLEESNGPYFGASGPFDPSKVKRRVVGTMTFVLRENGDGSLGYTVNGVSVAKTVRRYAFRKNDLSGNYQGSVVMRSDDPRGGSYDDANITIDDQGDRVNMHIEILTGPTCDYALNSIQYGAQRSLYGDYSCAGRQGRIEMNDLMVTAEGFTGTYQGPAGHVGGEITKGHISGARR